MTVADLLEQIRTALDELTPLLHDRVVDIEMPRVTVEADAGTLHRALVAVIGRAVEHSEGGITVRVARQGTAAHIEVVAELPRGDAAVAGWPAALVADVEAVGGGLGGEGAALWLSVPLSGTGAPEA